MAVMQRKSLGRSYGSCGETFHPSSVQVRALPDTGLTMGHITQPRDACSLMIIGDPSSTCTPRKPALVNRWKARSLTQLQQPLFGQYFLLFISILLFQLIGKGRHLPSNRMMPLRGTQFRTPALQHVGLYFAGRSSYLDKMASAILSGSVDMVDPIKTSVLEDS